MQAARLQRALRSLCVVNSGVARVVKIPSMKVVDEIPSSPE